MRDLLRSSLYLAAGSLAIIAVSLTGCEPEFTDHLCSTDLDCFDDERCVAGQCLIITTPNGGEPDVGHEDDVHTNECGGTEYLDNYAGEPCGPCNLDEYICDGEDLVCSGETPCPELDLITTNPTDVEATSVTFNGEIHEFPHEEQLDEVGFCWSPDEDPTLEDSCLSLDSVPTAIGPFSLEVEGLAPGTSYHVRAYSIDEAGGEMLANEVNFLTSAPAPVVEAAGTQDAVVVTWDEVEGATGFEVYANGDLLETIDDATTLEYEDETAPAGTVGIPQNPSASQTRTDGVRLTWSAAQSQSGADVEYTVVATYPDTDSEPSEAVMGSRSGPLPAGYEVRIGGSQGSWTAVGDVTEYLDEDAPRGPITPAAISASKGEHVTHVRLTTTSPTVGDPPTQTYQLRVVYGPQSEFAGDSTSEFEGQRATGQISYQWHRTSGEDDIEADYALIDGATAATYNDTDAPSDGSQRYYRVEVTAAGAETEFSDSDFGFVATAEPPSTLTASTDDADEITLIWEAVSNATGYAVYRDGTLLDTTDAATTTFVDDTAPEADLPAAPASAEMSAHDGASVTISWDAVVADAGANEVTYTVRSLIDTLESGDSPAAVGRRAAPDVESYEISIDGGAWISVTGTTYQDNDAPAPQITFDGVTASDGTDPDGVLLDIAMINFADGATVEYEIRTVDSADRRSADVAQAAGQRSFGASDTASVWWEYQDQGETEWSHLASTSLTAPGYFDEDAPADGTYRSYQALVQIDGAPDTLTNSTVVDGRIDFE